LEVVTTVRKKNLLNFDYNKSSLACDPCAKECKKIKRIINDRKLSDIKNEEVANILNIFKERG